MKKSVILTLCFLGLAVGAVGLALTVPTNPALTFNSVLSDAIALVETREDHAGHDDEGSDDEESQHRIDAATETGADHADHSDADEKPHNHGDESAEHTEDEDHKDHDGHDDNGSVNLTPEQMNTFDVRTATVASGAIAVTIERPAEVIYDENALAHVVPRAAGIARSVNAAEGDQVTEGQVLAVLESRELADAKATYLGSLERLALAEENFGRAEALIEKRIVSGKAHLAAKTDYAEARINLRSARQKLLAFGIDKDRLKTITEEADADLTEYVMRAPLSGTVVTRHLTRGESVPTDREAFVIADVSTVWVDISIYAHDLERVEAGQTVTIATDGGVEVVGTLAFVTPNVSEETRTANARVVLKNAPMRLRPGMFVTARITVAEGPAEVRIPATALQILEGRDVVFVKDGDGRLRPRPVTLGRRAGDYAEVLTGLRSGDTVVTVGSFVVKSQLAKSGFDDGHNH
jgi:membrane fusion protein, heavy metal efflux system